MPSLHRNNRSPDYQIYNKSEYFNQLVSSFSHASPLSKIVLMSMDFEPDEPAVAEVIDALDFAAQKGANIHLGIDARSFLASNGKSDPSPLHSSEPGPLFFHSKLPVSLRPPYDSKQKALAKFENYPNVNVTVTNTPSRKFSLPFAGRSHVKIAIIDDRVITGGCNLDYPDYVDQMIGWHDKVSANKLYEVFSSALTDGSIRRAFGDTDQAVPLPGGDAILIDAGVPGQSMIYDNALELIDSAQDWLLLTCQFFPNSVTAKHLAAARKRGVKLEIIFSHYSQHGFVGGSGQLLSQMIERTRVPRELFKDGLSKDGPKIHAKVIASDQGVMIGSHNYVRAGVQFGTAEIAFKSGSVELARESADKVRTQLDY